MKGRKGFYSFSYGSKVGEERLTYADYSGEYLLVSSPPLVTVDGLPLTDRRIRQGLRTNIVAGAFGMGWLAMALGIPLTMLFEALGAGGVMIGMTVTVQQLSMVAQVPAAFLSERLASRKLYWASLAVVHRVVWFLPALLPLLLSEHRRATAWSVLGVVLISSVLAQASAASWFSWMADLVPEGVGGRFWGKRQSWVMLAYLIAMGVAGVILDAFPTDAGKYTGFSIVFSIAALLGIADILVHLRVPEPRARRRTHQVKVMARLLEPLQDRDFRWLTCSMGMWYFGVGLVGSFAMIYLKRDFGASYTHIALITISASLGGVIGGFPLGYLADRVGARTFATILLVAAPAFAFAWFFVSPHPVHVYLPILGAVVVPQPIAMFACTNLVAGALYSGIGICQLHLASQLAPKEGRTVAMAMHWSIIGLLAALGPVIAGFIMDWVGEHPLAWKLPSGAGVSFYHVLAMGHVSVSWLICAPLMLMVRSRGGDLPLGLALARIGNPLRAMSNLYHIYQINSHGSSDKRAGAARRLGERKTSIAVSDLIEKLDDPSPDVREETVLALGKIGSPEAIQALIERLQTPESDLAPQIARALRENPAPASVDALLEKLSDGDRETCSESARTLGAIGDPRAIPSLLDLIRTTDDSKVLSASSEALARLGELAAIYEIIPHLRNTRNPVLKRSLAVAVADLLGTPGEFYRLLTRELQANGSELERLLKDLRRMLHKRLNRVGSDEEDDALLRMTLALESAYDRQEWRSCADLLLKLAIGIAAIGYSIDSGPDAKAVIADLVWRDQHSALGIWYLDALTENWAEENWGPIDQLDVLIGFYVIACLQTRLQRGPIEPPVATGESS